MRQDNQSNPSQYFFETPFENNLADDVNILLDKNSASQGQVNHVVFVTDLSDKSYKTFLEVLDISKTNNYVINFLYINKTSKNRLFTEDFKAELNRFTGACTRETCGIIWETPVKNEAKGIEEVVEQFGGELVVVACKNNSSIDLYKQYLDNFISVSKEVELVS